MTRTNYSPLFAARELFDQRYKGAEVIFVAGSVGRGEASTYSDLDLVVVFKKVSQAYRESFSHRDWPVEAFIHDPETLNYFLHQVDRPLGRGTLAAMISEGHEVLGPSTFSNSVKMFARDVYREGPPALLKSEIEDRRYKLSELIDDLREPRSRQELISVATVIYNELADYCFRTQRKWAGSGKGTLKRLKETDPQLARKFGEAFDLLFATGQTAGVIDLALGLLAPEGGVLFEGYLREASPTWRFEKP